MSFASGSVTFRRFSFTGRFKADRDAIEQHLFGRETGGPLVGMDQTECGWIGPEHLYDNDLDAIDLDARFVRIALRIDSLKIPGPVLKAYIGVEERAALKTHGRDYLSRAERRNARDAAMIRADKEMREGKFRRSAKHDVLIDTRDRVVYLGTTSSRAADKLLELFRETFDCTLEPLDAERLAYRVQHDALPVHQVLENVEPCHFVPDDMEFAPDGDDDGSQTFLGREFLSWLWYRSESNDGPIQTASGDAVALAIDRTIRLQCDFGRSGSTTLMRDGPARSPEAHSAITIGKQPTRMGLILGGGAGEFSLTLDGPTMSASGLALPKDEEQRSPVEWIEHRMEQIAGFCAMLDGMYGAFLKLRTSADWPRVRSAMQKWAAGSKAEAA